MEDVEATPSLSPSTASTQQSQSQSPSQSQTQLPQPPTTKKSTTLSVDRAAFLLLRVKKAFKKKRQQRKEKQNQLANAALAASQNRSCRKIPPPLLRSRTLPAIIVPGIPMVSLHTDRNPFQLDELTPTAKSSSSRWSMLTRHTQATTPSNNYNYNYVGYNNNNNSTTLKSLNLPRDDGSVAYRRKSSGSAPHSASAKNAAIVQQQQQQHQQQQQKQLQQQQQQLLQQQQQYQQAHISDASLLQMSDDFECQADGSVMLRIPAPHVVAARAYRLASNKRSGIAERAGSIFEPRSSESQLPQQCDGNSSLNNTSSGGSSSSSSTNTAFTRLAKLLHQTSVTASKQSHASDHILSAANATPTPSNTLTGGDMGSGLDDAPRRLSWERRKDSSALQRSASIDSFAEIVWSDTPRPSLDIPRAPFSKRPSASSLFSNCSSSSQGTQLNINYGSSGGSCGSGSGSVSGLAGDWMVSGGSGTAAIGNSRRESLLSPSSTRRNKLTRIINDNVLPHSLTNGNISCRIDREITTHNNDLTDNSPVLLRKSSATCNNAYNNNNSNKNKIKNSNSNNNNNNNSSNRNINNNNSNNHHAQTENVATATEATSHYAKSRRDNSIALHCNAPLNNAFRWSEQLTQNVSVAKIRTAISCTSQDLKEMEFLLPHAHTPVTTTPASLPLTVTTTTAIGAGGGMQHPDKSSSVLGLSIARHIRKSNEQSSSQQQLQQQQKQQQNNKSPQSKQAMKMHATARRHELSLSHTGNGVAVGAGGGGGGGKMLLTSSQPQPQRLAIHRHPSTARAGIAGVAVGTVAIVSGGNVGGGIKGAGNTPYYSKMSKKQLKLAQAQLDKLTQINLHLHALFSAVEHGHMDKARTILESTDVDVNSINSDGLSALDVAVLSNNRSMTKMLLQHGAVEGSQFSTETIGAKLNALLKDAESRIYDLSGAEGSCQPTFTARPSISSIIIGNTGSSVTGCTGNEIDKQIGIWERRVKGLRRMLLGWDQARPPDAPVSVTVDVTGESAMTVQILEPFESAICTKFKVQWSTRADFNNIVGERELMDFKSFHGTMGTQCYVSGLTPGRRYFVRATCGNVKGWGPYKTSVPASVVPSSWRDLNNREDRYVGQQRVLDNLFTAVRLARPADASELTLDPPATHRRNPKKKTTIKQLFSVASKFQKNLRRGIYLASIIYCEDKVLVTSEDFLPVIEIDETYPSTLHSDYHWLMKVACTWDDVKSLRSDMERNLTSAAHFRTKLLSAICQMQSALGLTDLGTLYYKPLRDSHGTVVLTCIQTVRSQKTVSILNSRWLPVNKLQKKIVALLEDYNINEMLISSVSDQIHYHQASSQRLEHGLYLGYLKMQCSVEQIQLVVPMKTPNVLPHYKVRDNSHITAEEWQILKRGEPTTASRNALGLSLEFSSNADGITEVQRLFLYDLTTAAHKLLAYMNIKADEAFTHRLYDIEVIEHSQDISFLVICPSVELTCAVPGQSELLLQRDDLASLSIQAFEMIHLRTYQPGIIQKYARLSCILELDTAAANHSHREAFSTSELQTAKERLVKLHELSASLNAVWKSVRWLMDVIAYARDKTAQSSAAMKEILDFAHTDDNSQQQQLLQLPIRDVKFTKSGSGRGSWPGPGANTHSGCGTETYSTVEHSKSEQNLGLSARTPTAPLETAITFNTATTTTSAIATGGNSSSSYSNNQQLLLANTDMMPRKNSGDSMSSQYTSRSFYSTAGSATGSNNELAILACIPPSRSDDTLSLAAAEALKHKQTGSLQRKRTSSNIISGRAANCSPPLITVYSSSSAPYLVGDVAMCNLSGKNDTKMSKVAATTGDEADTGKPKSISSINLRDGGLYLKSTLSALQTEIKDASGNVIELSAAMTTTTTATTNSEEDVLNVTPAQTSIAATAAATQSSGIIHVYTAYNTGLASGTSLKLHVTPKTTAREVINLVVKQLNMAAVLKGSNGPIYTADMLDNFCLVAIIGARERCLRDDFKPLLLQDPWRKGRLYVRQKHELLAAIEHANRKSHLI